jgi:MerR family mercuric resistance operon transcriptional regulator
MPGCCDLSNWRAGAALGLPRRDHPLLRAHQLLPLPSRSAGRYRLYDLDDVRRPGFIRRARELGFTLEEVRALLALSTHDGRTACAEVRQLAAGHLEEVRAQIADLKAMETVLTDAVRRCDAGELPGCPLIDSLWAVTD